jgi:phosphohistidine phosphatase
MIQTKYIFIVRHGHADFDSKPDKLRNLTKHGQQAVHSTSSFIQQKCSEFNLKIDLCICSNATRTIQTAEIICQQLNITNIESHGDLYSTVPSNWMDKIINSNDTKTLVLVGHNPTLSQLINQLTSSECYMNPANCGFIKLEIKNNELVLPATLLGYFNHE